MNDVLLLLPADRQVSRAIAVALDLAAARGVGLLAVAVIDVEIGARLTNRIVDVGLLGERMSDRVSEALAREHRIRAEALLGEASEQARARGIACRSEIESGDPDAVCRRVLAREQIGIAVVVVEKRSWLARMVTGSQPLRPAHLGGCEVVLVEED